MGKIADKFSGELIEALVEMLKIDEEELIRKVEGKIDLKVQEELSKIERGEMQ